jgi:alpha-tubulin suppressor-like RCC1 family protein
VTGLGRVAAGAFHTCAIRDKDDAKGKVVCWGSNANGQLGAVFDNIRVGDDEHPADLRETLEVNFERGVVQVAAGFAHTCVLFDDGKVRCWGRLVDDLVFKTVDGLLGTDDVVNDTESGFVDPLATGDVRLPEPAVQISAAAGGAHSCALLLSGKIACWGINDHGQCGIGPAGEGESVGGKTNEALSVVRLDAVALEVSVGAAHTCALLEGGLVTCWGLGQGGRLGYGQNTDRLEPLGAVPIGEPALHVTAGLGLTCVLLEGGRVRCWGGNDDGQLGYGHAEAIGDNETPEQAATMAGPDGNPLGGDVPVGGVGVVQVSAVADARAVCALFTSGAVRCWGVNDYGELGYGHTQTLGRRYTPQQLDERGSGGDLALGGSALALSIGGRCALLDSGALYCWGRNENAQLGLRLQFPEGGTARTPAANGPVIWE